MKPGAQRTGLGSLTQLVVFLFAAALVVSKESSVLFHPQFYGEGGVWYAQAYNSGWWHTFFFPAGGYLAIFPKIIVGLTLLGPLTAAPLLMNLAGIFVQVLPVNFLLSNRCANWGSLSQRFLMAAIYLCLPNAQEINVVLTNAQWHLAVLAALVVWAEPPASVMWRICDLLALGLCGLTGPFCLVLCPLAALWAWHARHRWSVWVFAVLATGCVFECLMLVCGGWASRIHASQNVLGGTPLLFGKILAGQVYLDALLGTNRFGLHANIFGVLLVVFFGTAMLVCCLWQARRELRFFTAFAFIMFVASLKNPLVSGPRPQWELMLGDDGARYWFLPMLAFLWCLAAGAIQSRNRALRIIAIVLLLISIRGAVHNSRYKRFRTDDFPEAVRAFSSASLGQLVVIPCQPPGMKVEIVKHN